MISFVPAKMKKIFDIASSATSALKADLNLGVIKAAAAYFPEGEIIREEVLAIVDMAQKDFAILATLSNKNGVKGYFQRVGADIVLLQSGAKKKSISWYVIWFEKFFHDLSNPEEDLAKTEE